MDQIVLDKKECTYSYFADPMYVFMDAEYNQFEVEAENMGDAHPATSKTACRSKWCSTTARRSRSNCRPASCARSPDTEPAVKGDTSGKVLKPAKIATGFEIGVPLFVAQGDKIEIDTRTDEYRKRV